MVRHGGAPAGWLDLSANPNPLGTPAEVRAAIATVRYDRYADLDRRAAERHLAADAGVPPTSVLLTAGATEALRLIASAFMDPGASVVIAGPTYGEYARLADLAGATIEEVRAAAPSFEPPIAALAAALVVPGRAMAIVADPNNPTGRPLGAAGHRRLLDALPAPEARDAILVVDQSFAPFAAARMPIGALLATDRVLLVRSLTKRLATPGVRVGYLLGAPRLLARLRAARDPWSVGAHAIAAASAARWELRRSERQSIVAWRRSLVAGLTARGLRPVRSDANFVLAWAGPRARDILAGLARRRIAVRDATSFELPGYLRFAVCPPAAQARLFAALDELDAVVALRAGASPGHVR